MSEVVGEVEAPDARAEERLSFLLFPLQALPGVVEAASEPGPDERLDLRALMVRRYEDPTPARGFRYSSQPERCRPIRFSSSLMSSR
jgi:hypothetical protein